MDTTQIVEKLFIITPMDYAAGAAALLLHYIVKGILDKGTFWESVNLNKRYIITSTLCTIIGFIGADDIAPTIGIASGFTFCIAWAGAGGTLLYNMFKFIDRPAEKRAERAETQQVATITKDEIEN